MTSNPKSPSALSWIYERITTLRNRLYDSGYILQTKVNIPVISIGNITVGGTGKTPLTLFIAEELGKEGFHPVILCKGYKGCIKNPTRVCSKHTYKDVGDEALIFAHSNICPVVASYNKSKGARFIERNQLGDIIVLDDGFQHRKLIRDVDIVCVNIGSETAVKDFTHGFVLPSGPFRENRDKALKRADILILSHRKPKAHSKLPDLRILRTVVVNTKVYESFYDPEGVFSLKDGSPLNPQNIVAFCAIANNESFFLTLEQLGFKIVAKRTLGDHLEFSSTQLQSLKTQFPGISLVCTEKDAVKLSVDEKDQIAFLRIKPRIIPAGAVIKDILNCIHENAQRLPTYYGRGNRSQGRKFHYL